MVWKVSRVGERAEIAASGAAGFRLLAFGFNSPFEEVSLASRLRTRGFATIRPVAVYRTGSPSKLSESVFDSKRFKTHRGILACDGEPVLVPHHNYVTLWEHWNGPKTELPYPEAERPIFRSLNLAQAEARGLLESVEVERQLLQVRERLSGIGVEVIRLGPTDVLVAMDADDSLIRDETGDPETCLCNFQFLSWPGEGDENEGP